jgi:hypothetical protein
MPYQTSERTNQEQNQIDFVLEPINLQPSCFKYKLFEKVLNPIQEDINKPRTCTIKCLYKDCK